MKFRVSVFFAELEIAYFTMFATDEKQAMEELNRFGDAYSFKIQGVTDE